jgi:hypothetical protein
MESRPQRILEKEVELEKEEKIGKRMGSEAHSKTRLG